MWPEYYSYSTKKEPSGSAIYIPKRKKIKKSRRGKK